MAKNSNTNAPSAASVAETAMPGWKVVKETSLNNLEAASDAVGNDPEPTADAVMPSLDQLKAKYLGVVRTDAVPDPASYANAAADAADTTLVEMEAGPLKKTVAVSKKGKKVIWSQG